VVTDSPFDDVEDSLEKALRSEPSRESVHNFWLTIAGLAVLVHLVAVTLTSAVSYYQDILFRSSSYLNLRGMDWQTAELIRKLVAESFVPSIVIASVIPILYWRGNLIQRFAISLVIALTVLNLVGGNYWRVNFRYLRMLLPGLIAICLCWISLPILFSKTPIRTKQLRLIVATAIFILAFCVSLFHMYEAAANERYLFWETFYAVAFCLALIRRNWGSVATLEATATHDQIETTSSRTLMEMMIVGSLACAAAMYWSVRPDTLVLLDLGSAAGLAFVSVWASTWTIGRGLERRSTSISNLLIWFGMGLYFACSILLVNIFQFARFSITVNWISITMVTVTAFGVSAIYFFYLNLVTYWLRFCGWTFAKSKSTERAIADG
jgi:hypothetical protein